MKWTRIYPILALGFWLGWGISLRAQNASASLSALETRFASKVQKAPANPQRLQPQSLIRVFAGYFSNERAVEAGKGRVSVMVCMPVWEKRRGEHWVYFTRFFAGSEEKPFMQYLYKIENIHRDTLVATMYTLAPADAVLHRLAWLEKQPLKGLSPEQLTASVEGRLVITPKQLTQGFFIRPEGERCRVLNPQTEVHSFDMRMFVQEEGIESSVRFFDANGQLVFDNQNTFYQRLQDSVLREQLNAHLTRKNAIPAPAPR